jgi:hypothetical protein
MWLGCIYALGDTNTFAVSLMEYAVLCCAWKMAIVNETLMKDVCMYFMTWSASTNLIYGVRTFLYYQTRLWQAETRNINCNKC